MATIFVIFGYTWTLTLLSEQLREKASKRRYRFSFLKFCYTYENSLYKVFSKFNPFSSFLNKVLSRSFSSLLFVLVIDWVFSASNTSQILLPTVVGSLVAEIGHHFILAKN